MKRTFSLFDGANEAPPAGATPRNLIPRPSNAGRHKTAGNSTKRARQTTLRFTSVDTPTISGAAQPEDLKETPILLGGQAVNPHPLGSFTNNDWPSTAQRALEKLRVNTPGLPSIGHQVGSLHYLPSAEEDDSSRQYADTCLHPLGVSQPLSGPASDMCLGGVTGYDDFIVDEEEEEDGFDAGFRILSSQTYIRPPTQQEPADERSVSWQDAWAGIERRASQHTHEPAPTHGPDAATSFGAALAVRTQHMNHERHMQRERHMNDMGADEPAMEDGDDLTSVITQAAGQTQSQSQSQRVTPHAPTNAAPQGAPFAAHRPEHPDHPDGEGHPHPGGAASGAQDQAVTPELMLVQPCPQAMHEAAGGQPPAVGSEKPLAALFRPKSQRKLLLIVRHGESEYNHACTESRSYADPLIFDPKLTQRGINQCTELRRKLSALLSERTAEYGEPLWVLSPLTRALQTFMLACPYPERLPPLQPAPLMALTNGTQPPQAAAASGAGVFYQVPRKGGCAGGSCSSGAGPSCSAGPSHAQPPARLKVAVLPSIAEFMVTPGDVGRPPAHLIRDFPQLAEELHGLPEVWWHHTATKTSCALTNRFEGIEPRNLRKQRVQEFGRWLETRRERLFVLVGHSCFWHSFMGNHYDKRLTNCEVFCMPY